MKVHNKYLNFLFNKLDLPIRFIYTQTGPISKVLNNLLFWKLYSSDFKDLDKKFWRVFDFIRQANIEFKNTIILELGPGNSYLNAYHFLLQGAKRVILVDKFPRHSKTAKQKDYMNSELNYVLRQYPGTPPFFITKQSDFDGRYLRFIEGELVDLKTIERVDFIYSVSVLEHMKNVSGNIRRMTEILKPGGYMYHLIDLRDHYNFNSPFLFYKYPDWLWEKFLTKEGISYTNRWRYEDFISEFKSNGLDVVEEEVEKFAVDPNLKINEKFKSYKHKDIGILDINLR